MKNEITQHGFDFGSMRITRTSQDAKASIICVATKKARFSIRSTPNGSIRFFDEYGNECELVSKEHIEYL